MLCLPTDAQRDASCLAVRSANNGVSMSLKKDFSRLSAFVRDPLGYHDRKYAWGMLLYAATLACILISFVLGDRETVYGSVLVVSLFVASMVFLANGLAAVCHEFWDKEKLNYLDLVWQLATAAGVVVALAQMSLDSKRDHIAILNANAYDSLKSANELAEIIYRNNCTDTPTQSTTSDFCKAVARTRNATGVKSPFSPGNTVIEQLARASTQSDDNLQRLIGRLRYAEEVQEGEAKQIGDDLKSWSEGTLYTIQFFVALALAVRTVKTTGELWWMDKRPTVAEAAPADASISASPLATNGGDEIGRRKPVPPSFGRETKQEHQ